MKKQPCYLQLVSEESERAGIIKRSNIVGSERFQKNTFRGPMATVVAEKRKKGCLYLLTLCGGGCQELLQRKTKVIGFQKVHLLKYNNMTWYVVKH